MESQVVLWNFSSDQYKSKFMKKVTLIYIKTCLLMNQRRHCVQARLPVFSCESVFQFHIMGNFGKTVKKNTWKEPVTLLKVYFIPVSNIIFMETKLL